MKTQNIFFCRFFSFVFFSLISLTTIAQNNPQRFVGHWKGAINMAQNTSVEILLHITQSNGKIQTKLSSSRGLTGLPIKDVQATGNHFQFTIKAYAVNYKGVLTKNKKIMQGTWQQAGQKLPLNFRKITANEAFFTRKQTPRPPFPYREQEVTYTNPKDNVTLSGTLTVPQGEGKFPVVILLSVAGPNNRDQAFAGHKPYAVIADYLTRKGIAILRSDDRGVGKSQGNLFQSTIADFAEDTQAAITFLKKHPQIDTQRIYLLGNSEGGAVAGVIAAQNPQVAGIILLASPGIGTQQIILKQGENLGKTLNYSDKQIAIIQQRGKELFQIITTEKDNPKARKKIKALLKKYKDAPSLPNYFAKTEDEAIDMYLSPWYRYQLTFKSSEAFEKVKCPVLALNGSLDRVIMPKENLQAIHQSLIKADNSDITIRQIPGLNHIFQTAKTGSPLEYGSLEESFSPKALKIIYQWLEGQLH